MNTLIVLALLAVTPFAVYKCLQFLLKNASELPEFDIETERKELMEERSGL